MSDSTSQTAITPSANARREPFCFPEVMSESATLFITTGPPRRPNKRAGARLRSAARSGRRAFRPFARVRVLDDLHVGERDQTLVDHLVEGGQHAPYLLLRVYHGDHDGQVGREAEPAGAVQALLRAVAHQAAVDGRAGDVHHPQLPDYRLVQRLALPAVVLA